MSESNPTLDKARTPEEKTRFSHLFVSTFEGIGISENGIMVDGNPAFCQMWGYSLEDVTGMSVVDLIAQEDRDLVIGHNLSGYSKPFEFKALRKDGSTLFMEAWGKMHIIDDRTLRVTAVRDISERKELEEAVRLSEEKYSTAFHHSPDAIAITRISDSKIIEMNPGFSEITGWDHEDTINANGQELGIWPDPDERLRIAEKLQTDGVIKNIEATITTKSGDQRNCLLSAELSEIHGEQHMISVARDITEEIKTRTALRQSEEHFSTIFHTHPGPITVTNKKTGALVQVNDGFTEWSGFSREEAIGRSSFELGLTSQIEQDRVASRAHIDGTVDGLEVKVTTKNGSERWVLASIRPIEFQGLPHLISISQDITDLKRAQEVAVEKEKEVRNAYASVFQAATNNKLLLLTPDELDEMSGEQVRETFCIDTAERLTAGRQFVRDCVAEEFPSHAHRSNDIILTCSEAITNAEKHAGNCLLSLHRTDDGALQIKVSDRGPGINFSDLPKAALVPGFSTVGTLGMGFTLILEMMDKVMISTSDTGTDIVLELSR